LPTDRFLRLRILFAFLFLVSLITGSANLRAAPQTSSCDPLLEQPKTNPYGYRLRTDRCEGIYVQQVAGATLLVASFTAAFDEYDLNSARNLTVRWTAPASSEVHLRAFGLRRKLYYRMDATRPSAGRFYDWPVDVLAGLNLPRAEIGMVGWIRHPVGKIERDLYLPLQVSAKDGTSGAGPYTLVLLPGVPLSEVYVSVASVGSDGRPATWIRDEQPLKYNYYPAERPIDIRIDRPATSGLYYVLISADIASGGSLTTELWFYDPPR
jgi:hypothetical protein